MHRYLAVIVVVLAAEVAGLFVGEVGDRVLGLGQVVYPSACPSDRSCGEVGVGSQVDSCFVEELGMLVLVLVEEFGQVEERRQMLVRRQSRELQLRQDP